MWMAGDELGGFGLLGEPARMETIDREVYLPKAWTDDPARCAAAGVPEKATFATEITLARRKLARALDAGVSAAWGNGGRVLRR
jgi:DDE superfamily endonuclease